MSCRLNCGKKHLNHFCTQKSLVNCETFASLTRSLHVLMQLTCCGLANAESRGMASETLPVRAWPAGMEKAAEDLPRRPWPPGSPQVCMGAFENRISFVGDMKARHIFTVLQCYRSPGTARPLRRNLRRYGLLGCSHLGIARGLNDGPNEFFLGRDLGTIL